MIIGIGESTSAACVTVARQIGGFWVVLIEEMIGTATVVIGIVSLIVATICVVVPRVLGRTCVPTA